MNPVFRALSLLKPFDVDVRKIRIGPETDGGYVLLDRIDSTQTVLSYGVSTEYRFEEEMGRCGHKVYMFDHTIDGISASNQNMIFTKQGVSAIRDEKALLYTLADHMDRHSISGDRSILKMDVEGAEFAVLSQAHLDYLSRFEQIILEVHGLVHLADPAYRRTFEAAFRKLNEIFSLVHVHANNCDGGNGLKVVDGFIVSNLLELSYVKTSVVNRFPCRTLFPTDLDYPNVRQRDKLLWFFPFMPTTASDEQLAGCIERVDLTERS